MKINRGIILGVIGIMLTNIVGLMHFTRVEAAPGDVIINEIMYNPSTGNQDDEFLELYNTTGSPIDLEGWSFSDGITLTFGPGVTIGANDYLVVSPSISQTMTTYGVEAAAQYAPTNLSNGGETITLVDDTSAEVDSVTYDDAAPWPTSPDGNGPSLELKDTSLDNSNPANWAASLSSGGTPLAENSVVGLELPEISDVTDPNDITENDDVTITATVTGTGITSVELDYKINFDADVTLTMHDDGNHNDGAAGDDVYGATIPAQSNGTLVRFKVTATNADGSSTSPSVDDSINYHGYYIRDPGETSPVAPIIDWFMSDADYNDMHTNHVWDNEYLPSVVVYGNDVYDNAVVRIRGEGSRTLPKKSYKFKLPSGYTINPEGGTDTPINEFHLINNLKASAAHLLTPHWVTEQTGLATYEMLPSRVYKNGSYYGFYMYVDKYDREWRSTNGYDTGEMYEDTNQVVNNADDLTRVNNLSEYMNNQAVYKSDELKDYVMDNFDLPKTFNFVSAMALLKAWDHSSPNNNLQYYDTERERWSSLLWDQEGLFMFSPKLNPTDGRTGTLTFCYTYCGFYPYEDLRALYFRRVKTLVDELYATDALKDKFIEFDTTYADEMALDEVAWPDDRDTWTLDILLQHYEYAKANFLSYHTVSWALPASQTQQEKESISFDQVVKDADDNNEYIKLSNSSGSAVDLSNWVIDELDYTIPPGCVIPANGSIYLVGNDITFKANNDPLLVCDDFNLNLDDFGTMTLKTNTDDIIDVYSD